MTEYWNNGMMEEWKKKNGTGCELRVDPLRLTSCNSSIEGKWNIGRMEKQSQNNGMMNRWNSG